MNVIYRNAPEAWRFHKTDSCRPARRHHPWEAGLDPQPPKLAPRAHGNYHVMRGSIEEVVDFGGHNEIVVMQPFDLLRLQAPGRIAPPKADVGVMVFTPRRAVAQNLSASRKLRN